MHPVADHCGQLFYPVEQFSLFGRRSMLKALRRRGETAANQGDCALEISMVGEAALIPFARGLHFVQLDYFGHENIPFS
jgi:hypothetical protein